METRGEIITRLESVEDDNAARAVKLLSGLIASRAFNCSACGSENIVLTAAYKLGCVNCALPFPLRPDKSRDVKDVVEAEAATKDAQGFYTSRPHKGRVLPRMADGGSLKAALRLVCQQIAALSWNSDREDYDAPAEFLRLCCNDLGLKLYTEDVDK